MFCEHARFFNHQEYAEYAKICNYICIACADKNVNECAKCPEYPNKYAIKYAYKYAIKNVKHATTFSDMHL